MDSSLETGSLFLATGGAHKGTWQLVASYFSKRSPFSGSMQHSPWSGHCLGVCNPSKLLAPSPSIPFLPAKTP